MRTSSQQAGDAAESQVARRLLLAGWTILGRQVRIGRAEIDLVAVDPGPPQAVVIVEVRYRRRRDFGLPEETVDHHKRRILRGAAFTLIERGCLPDGTPFPKLPLRFDLVVVEPETLRHHRNAA